jgi:hypothetical protein
MYEGPHAGSTGDLMSAVSLRRWGLMATHGMVSSKLRLEATAHVQGCVSCLLVSGHRDSRQMLKAGRWFDEQLGMVAVAC